MNNSFEELKAYRVSNIVGSDKNIYGYFETDGKARNSLCEFAKSCGIKTVDGGKAMSFTSIRVVRYPEEDKLGFRYELGVTKIEDTARYIPSDIEPRIAKLEAICKDLSVKKTFWQKLKDLFR